MLSQKSKSFLNVVSTFNLRTVSGEISLCLKKVQDMKNIYYIFRGTAPKVLPKAQSNLEWTK